MKLLAIDSATEVCGVALTENNKLVADYRLSQRNVHNEKLVCAIQFLAEEATWRLEELSGIAVSIGPGSFTGLRIGISVSKGLAFALGIPVVTVDTLEALAFGAKFWTGQVCTILKARADEFYFARFEKDLQQIRRRGDYQILDIDSIQEYLPEKALVITYPADLVSAFLGKGRIPASHNEAILSALAVAELGYLKLQNEETANLDSVQPFYLKDFEPKRKVYVYDSHEGCEAGGVGAGERSRTNHS